MMYNYDIQPQMMTELYQREIGAKLRYAVNESEGSLELQL